MSDCGEAGYTLALPFDTDDPEFVRGFECGTIWRAMQQVNGFPECVYRHGVDATVHASNAEMIMRMCEALKFRFTAEPAGEDWLHVTLTSPWHPAKEPAEDGA